MYKLRSIQSYIKKINNLKNLNLINMNGSNTTLELNKLKILFYYLVVL